MTSTAGQISRDLFRFDFRRFVAVGGLPSGGSAAWPGFLAHEDMTARAVGSAGLAALLTLPFLLLSSVLLAAPLAVPAAIGLGYLAMSHALVAQHRRRAMLINALVLFGLVGWLLLYLLVGEGPLSNVGMIAALLAPVFAAAPAGARSLMGMKPSRIAPSAGSASREAALARVACLDEMTPTELVLVLDREGSVLAATAAARKALRLLPDAFEHPLSALVDAGELQRLLDGLDRCGTGAAPELARAESLHLGWAGGREQSFSVRMTRCSDGSIAMRLQEDTTAEPRDSGCQQEAASPVTAQSAKQHPLRSRCDISDSSVFVRRLAEARATAKGIALTFEIEPNLYAACGRQAGRRILHHLVEVTLAASPAGGAVNLIARRLKGVVLLRAQSEPRPDGLNEATESDARLDVATLRSLVESAGGTLVVDRRGERIALSARLDVAGQASRTQVVERVEVG